MPDSEDNGEHGPRDFSLFLLDRRPTHDELSQKLYSCVEAVRDTGKKGSLQLTINIELFDGDPDRVVINDKIILKMPEHDRKMSVFYATEDGNLSRTDPNQLSPEFFRNVDVETGEFKEPTQ